MIKITLLILLIICVKSLVVFGNQEIQNDVLFLNFQAELAALQNSSFSETDIINMFGYTIESHTLFTTDGYILTIHRILHPNVKRNGKVAFLQHGILSSSIDWTIQGPGKSLALLLVDEGYDVWMGNARGNTYSRKHISLNPDKDSKFWEFSWHEIGTIDIPQMIDYILIETKADGIYYLGHSQGTTVFYVMTTMLPEYNNKIKAHVSLAPIAFMNHMTSPILHVLAFWRFPIEIMTNLIGVNEFLPTNPFMRHILADKLCGKDTVTQILCTNSLFAVCGFSRKQMNTTLLPIMMHFTPAGSSSRQIFHYAQEINSGYFRQYEHGPIGNVFKYGSLFPPSYDLQRVTAPVYLIYSRNDWLAGEIDVNRLCDSLGKCAGQILVADYEFNHLDFVFGIDSKPLVYNKVLSIFDRH